MGKVVDCEKVGLWNTESCFGGNVLKVDIFEVYFHCVYLAQLVIEKYAV